MRVIFGRRRCFTGRSGQERTVDCLAMDSERFGSRERSTGRLTRQKTIHRLFPRRFRCSSSNLSVPNCRSRWIRSVRAAGWICVRMGVEGERSRQLISSVRAAHLLGWMVNAVFSYQHFSVFEWVWPSCFIDVSRLLPHRYQWYHTGHDI